MTKQEYVKSLRELADFLESKPLPDDWAAYLRSEIKENYSAPAHLFRVSDKKTFGKIVATLGSFEKSTTDYDVRVEVTLPNGAIIIVVIEHKEICEKIVTGKKKVPFTPARLIDAIPEYEEEIVEWKCPDSFVALKGEKDDISG